MACDLSDDKLDDAADEKANIPVLRCKRKHLHGILASAEIPQLVVTATHVDTFTCCFRKKRLRKLRRVNPKLL